MDKDLFARVVINNKVLHHAVFKNIYWIHRKVELKAPDRIVKWNRLLHRPDLAIEYNYSELVRQHYQLHSVDIQRILKKYKPNDSQHYTHMSNLRKTLMNSIHYNNVPILQYLLDDIIKDSYKQMIRDTGYWTPLSLAASSKTANITTIEYLYSLYLKDRKTYDCDLSYALKISVLSGNLDKCKWFFDTVSNSNNTTTSDIKELSEIQQLTLQQEEMGEEKEEVIEEEVIEEEEEEEEEDENEPVSSMLIFAGEVGSKEIFLWILENNPEVQLSILYENHIFGKTLWSNAITNGNIELLDYLYDKCQHLKESFAEHNLLCEAVQYGNFEVLDWLRSRNAKYSNSSLLENSFICFESNTESLRLLEWIHKHKLLENNNNSDQQHPQILDLVEWFNINATKLHINSPFESIYYDYQLSTLKWLYFNYKDTAINNKKYNSNNDNDELNSTSNNEEASIIFSEYMTKHLIYCNSPEVVKWIYYNVKANEVKWPVDTLLLALRNFHPNEYDWINDNLPQAPRGSSDSIDINIFLELVQEDSLDAVKWLYRNKKEFIFDMSNRSSLVRTIQSIIQHFDEIIPDIQEFILDIIVEITPYTYGMELFKVNETMVTMIFYRYPHLIEDYTLRSSAEQGFFGAVKLLNSKLQEIIQQPSTSIQRKHSIYEVYREAVYFSVYNDFYDVVVYLFENGPPEQYDFTIIKESLYDPMEAALVQVNLSMIKYLHFNTPFKATTCNLDYIAKRGNLNVVKWLVENGFHGTDIVLSQAVQSRKYDIVKYILENTNHKPTLEIIDIAKDNENLDIVDLLKSYL